MRELPNSNSTRDIAHVIHPFTNLALHHESGPLTITAGRGIFVTDDTGNEYIDGMAGLWCASLGFSESALVDAATEQLKRLPYYHSFFRKATVPMIDLAEKLARLVPLPDARIFFANSGSEANDSAVKLVWYYNNALGRPQKKKIISRERAFHGVTVASGSLTGVPNIHRDFDLPVGPILHTLCPDFYHGAEGSETEEQFASRMADALESLILREGPDTVAAFIADPVMCAAGVITPPRTYFEKVQAILKRYDILFIADEIICGFGRTGNMFGSQTYGLRPDIMTCAKALTSAYFPMSAVIISGELWSALVHESNVTGGFWHGFTYTGHPVGAAVALRNLELMEERRIPEHVRRVSKRFHEGLAAFRDNPLVGDVRGVGLLGAVQLTADKQLRSAFKDDADVAAFIAQRAEEHGLIIVVRGGAVCFCPPLIITDAEVDELFRRFGLALADTELAVRERGLGG